MSSNNSILKNKFGKNYALLNKRFPGIEGNLLMHLDPYIVAEALDKDKHPMVSYDKIEFELIGDKDICIYFDFSQQRLRIEIYSSYKRKNKTARRVVDTIKVKKAIEARFNIQYNSNRQSPNSLYSFRYNYKNCKRIVDMINFIQYEFIDSK